MNDVEKLFNVTLAMGDENKNTVVCKSSCYKSIVKFGVLCRQADKIKETLKRSCQTLIPVQSSPSKSSSWGYEQEVVLRANCGDDYSCARHR